MNELINADLGLLMIFVRFDGSDCAQVGSVRTTFRSTAVARLFQMYQRSATWRVGAVAANDVDAWMCT